MDIIYGDANIVMILSGNRGFTQTGCFERDSYMSSCKAEQRIWGKQRQVH